MSIFLLIARNIRRDIFNQVAFHPVNDFDTFFRRQCLHYREWLDNTMIGNGDRGMIPFFYRGQQTVHINQRVRTHFGMEVQFDARRRMIILMTVRAGRHQH